MMTELQSSPIINETLKNTLKPLGKSPKMMKQPTGGRLGRS